MPEMIRICQRAYDYLRDRRVERTAIDTGSFPSYEEADVRFLLRGERRFLDRGVKRRERYFDIWFKFGLRRGSLKRSLKKLGYSIKPVKDENNLEYLFMVDDSGMGYEESRIAVEEDRTGLLNFSCTDLKVMLKNYLGRALKKYLVSTGNSEKEAEEVLNEWISE